MWIKTSRLIIISICVYSASVEIHIILYIYERLIYICIVYLKLRAMRDLRFIIKKCKKKRSTHTWVLDSFILHLNIIIWLCIIFYIPHYIKSQSRIWRGLIDAFDSYKSHRLTLLYYIIILLGILIACIWHGPVISKPICFYNTRREIWLTATFTTIIATADANFDLFSI